ncbi:hypothetical protein LZ31DRAFT_554240 [Colletotrichum somersetense]|nr:hypothetical protein LZ31DRAFT_554240 [Colletotrichum somersetense]
MQQLSPTPHSFRFYLYFAVLSLPPPLTLSLVFPIVTGKAFTGFSTKRCIDFFLSLDHG